MSDEIPGGLVIDPDEQPAETVQTPLTVAPEPPAPEPQAPADPDEDVSDVPQIDLREGKFVPVSAMAAERKKGKEALRAAKEEADSLRAKAKEADEMRASVQAARPWIEALKNRPDLIRQIQQAPAPQPEEPTLSPEEAESLARTLELFTPQGEPDVKRAQATAKLVDKLAERKAAKAVAPMIQNDHQRASLTQFQRVLNIRDGFGEGPDPEILKAQWLQMPPEMTANPEVAEVLWDRAMGITRRLGKPAPKPPDKAPLVSEAPGGRTTQPHNLSDLERAVARSRNMTQKQWAESQSGYKPGAFNVLED